ncbi:hypothetical protein P5673_014059 [Acropora cervicornis]|uniref:Uncharacterized protein n=1 Tax=Acropora cervicornis TaxID=6130 RepID=A0AAD9QKQ1_ACRCE|nr:hypothetical protein P5673_014059 [Acropora cervicornis]
MKGSAFFTKNNGVKLEKSSVFHPIRLVIVTFSGTLKLGTYRQDDLREWDLMYIFFTKLPELPSVYSLRIYKVDQRSSFGINVNVRRATLWFSED